MLSFKQFLELKENYILTNKRKIPALYVGHIPFRTINESLEKPTQPELKRLHKSLSDVYHFSQSERDALINYGFASYPVNMYLLAMHHMNQVPSMLPDIKHSEEVVEPYDIAALDSATDRKIDRNLVVHSTIGFDPRNKISSNGLLHLPCYTSTTLDPKVAYNLGDLYRANTGDHLCHVLKIHLKPGDRGSYVEPAKLYDDTEREILLPRNTTLRITHSELDKGDKVIHHAEVVHGIHPDEIEKDPVSLLFAQAHLANIFRNQGYNFITHPDYGKIAEHLVNKNPTLNELNNLAENLPGISGHEMLKPIFTKVLSNQFNRGDYNITKLLRAKRNGFYEPSIHDDDIKNNIISSLGQGGNLNAETFTNLMRHGYIDHDDIRNNWGHVGKRVAKMGRDHLKSMEKDGNFGSENVETAKMLGISDENLGKSAEKVLKTKLNSGAFPAKVADYVDSTGGFDDESKNISRNLLFNRLKQGVHWLDSSIYSHLTHALKNGYFDDGIHDALKDTLISRKVAPNPSAFSHSGQVKFAKEHDLYAKYGLYPD